MADDTPFAMFLSPRKFARDSMQILQRCAKPDKREFEKVAQAVAVGMLFIGFIGYFIKLVHIPINYIIVGS